MKDEMMMKLMITCMMMMMMMIIICTGVEPLVDCPTYSELVSLTAPAFQFVSRSDVNVNLPSAIENHLVNISKEKGGAS